MDEALVRSMTPITSSAGHVLDSPKEHPRTRQSGPSTTVSACRRYRSRGYIRLSARRSVPISGTTRRANRRRPRELLRCLTSSFSRSEAKSCKAKVYSRPSSKILGFPVAPSANVHIRVSFRSPLPDRPYRTRCSGSTIALAQAH